MSKVTAWERVKIAREPDRPTALDYIEDIFDDFIELCGDRYFKDDKSIVCGLGNIGNQNYTIIGEQKGRNTPITFNNINTLNRMKSSSAFIHRGVVYINVDHAEASSPIHEYMHIVLASMKFSKDPNTRNKFYDILNHIKNTNEYQTMLDDIRNQDSKTGLYSNLYGSDLQEEVVVHLLEKEFLTGFKKKWDNPVLKDLKQSVVNILQDLLGIDSIKDQNLDNLGKTSLQDLLLFFNSKLIVPSESIDELAIPTNQTIANIKATLAKNSQITWKNC